MTTPREEADIAEAIAMAEKQREVAQGQLSLHDSTLQLGELYVTLKEMGVDKENILDLIRLPFMFAAVPTAPGKAAAAIADIDKVDRSN